NQLAESWGVLPHAPSSFTSPLCVEGVCVERPDGIFVNGQPALSLGVGRWVANVDLSVDPEPIETRFPDGRVAGSLVTWQPTNVLSEGSIDIRVGDSLLLTAISPDGVTVPATVT